MKRRSWLALVVVLLALWANGVSSYAARLRVDDDIAQFCDDAIPCVVVVHESPIRLHVIVEAHVPPQLALADDRPIIDLAPKTSPPR